MLPETLDVSLLIHQLTVQIGLFLVPRDGLAIIWAVRVVAEGLRVANHLVR